MLYLGMKEKQGGFTIVELMFTVLVLAVLLGLGIPNFRDFLLNSRMSAQANDLLSGINLARSEAVKRRDAVTLCVGTAAAGCTSGQFADGWIVFADEDADGTPDGGPVLRDHGAMPDMRTAVYETTSDEGADEPDYKTSATRYVSFGANGFRRTNDGTLPVALGLVICDERGNVASGGGPDMSTARAVEFTTTGRASITRSIARIETLGGCP
jgi:type IV fimbrial biogenesis protein FimT